MAAKSYDVVIIGGGPAGLSAGIYAARARLSTVMIEKDIIGGNIVNAELVENYPGFADGVGGYDLTQAMHKQATKFGMETLVAEVIGLTVAGGEKTVKTSEGDIVAGAVIIGGGSTRQKLGVPGEKDYTGRGVSYCATCDAAFFVDKPVAVVGGGNAAIYEALHIARFASSVAVIHRRNELRATKIAQERAFADHKIKFIWNSVVQSIEGKDKVKEVRLKDVVTGKESVITVDGVFVSIGFKPNTDYLRGILNITPDGYVVVNDRMETGVPGIYAAGDIRANSIRQVISACGDGATAAVYADRYLGEKK